MLFAFSYVNYLLINFV